MAAIFKRGRPSNSAENTVKVLRYLPRPRTAWMPHAFRRENMDPQDLGKLWNKGRKRHSPDHPESGYATAKSFKREDQTIDLIPKHELEKYMPNIDLGPKALVTPVSLMSARAGHRVTHDLLHSYDEATTASTPQGAKGIFDHDAVSPLDSGRVGLHPAAVSCRSRIYRWMRRGPFSQEGKYYRRTALARGVPKVNEAEKPLVKTIIALAGKGHVRAACEEYRKLTFIPPVEVYRALLAACVPGVLLADAVAIFEDGMKLVYATRDAECFKHLLSVAIAAEHPERVMWVLNHARGTWSENVHARATLEALHLYELHATALAFLCDVGCETEARAVYSYIADAGMLDYDLSVRLGQQLRKALEKGEKIAATGAQELSVAKATAAAAPEILKAFAARLDAATRTALLPKSGALPTDGAAALALLVRSHPDVDVAAVLRHARFSGDLDLGASDFPRYTDRALAWLDLLSDRRRSAAAKPLPYLLKSKRSATSDAVRVAAIPEEMRRRRTLPTEAGFSFHYTPATRFVQETYPSLNVESLAGQYLVRNPVHRDVDCCVKNYAVPLPTETATPRVLHPSVAAARDAVLASTGANFGQPAVEGAAEPAAPAGAKQQVAGTDMESRF